jgi:hypothetical protein
MSDEGWADDRTRSRPGAMTRQVERLRRILPDSLEGRLSWALIALIGFEAFRFIREFLRDVSSWAMWVLYTVKTVVVWVLGLLGVQ